MDGVAGALKKSMEALSKYEGSLSKFLSASSQNMRTIALARRPLKLFTISNPFNLEDLIDKNEWGVDGIMLDLSKPNWKGQQLEHLRAAANFGGTVYLVSVQLSEQEAYEWWKALCSSLTPPKSLHIALMFLSYDQGFRYIDITDPAPGRELLDAVSKNPKMRDVTVVHSEMNFLNFPSNFPLTYLCLLDVEVDDSFLKSLEEGGYRPLTSLTLSFLKRPIPLSSPPRLPKYWRPSFVMLLGGDLKRLALEGFHGLWPAHLIAFMKYLGRNKCLEYLSLDQCSGFEATPDVVASVVDALLESGLPHLNIQGTALAENAAIEAQLGRNQAKHRQTLKSYEKVPATTVRLFICGDAYAGKTTLLTSLSASSAQFGYFQRATAYILQSCCCSQKVAVLGRTRGIEVRELAKDGIHVSVWDMAGQVEFHAFHNHMFPDPSAQGNPALFLFVWSAMDSKDERMGRRKAAETFEASFRYWLKFITSKTRQSNVTRKIIVVLTRKDQMDFLRESIATSLALLTNSFQKIIEVVGVYEVDARNPSSVEVVASSIFRIAASILDDVQVYKVCSEVNTHLSQVDSPILTWEDFQTLCQRDFHIQEVEHQMAIASSLHESGHLIYFRSVPFLILNVNWFCHEVMGDLIHFSDPQASARTMPFNGFVPQQFLEKLLEKGTATGVSGVHLVQLMEAMHLCCQVPNDANTTIFIPTTLCSSNTTRLLCWRGRMAEHNIRDADFSYVGRRLQCRHKDITFLTPGLFPLIQVSFNKVFCSRSDVVLDKDYISIWYQAIEIVVEFCKANGEHVIDVLVRSSGGVDQSSMLKLVEDMVISSLIQMCAQPIGNQGVELIQGIIRPACLEKPAPSHEREDQCVLIQDLKEDLRRQLQEGPQQGTFLHTWKHNSYFEVGVDPILELLGFERYWEVVKSYECTLLEVLEEIRSPFNGKGEMQDAQAIHANTTSSALMRIASARVIGRQEVKAAAEGLDQRDAEGMETQNVDTICHNMTNSILQSIDSKIDIMASTLHGMDKKLDVTQRDIKSVVASVAMLKSEVMPQIQRRIEQFWALSIGGKTPRLCHLTTDEVGIGRRLLSSLIKDVKNVRIELFCEDREHPHRVDKQQGICITTLSEGALKKALPYVKWLLKVLTLVSKVGAHVVAGAGASIPDFSKIIALMLDTPGLLDIQGVPDMEEAIFTGWQEWLVSVLEQNGGMTNSNIASKFKLRRALYHDTSRVAWLCDIHYRSQHPFPLT